MTSPRLIRVLLLSLGLLATAWIPPPEVTAQASTRLQIRAASPEQGYVPIVEVEGTLLDGSLLEALQSGLPLRFQYRVELWEDRFFDRLRETAETNFALSQDPIDRSYLLTLPHAERRYITIGQAERAIAGQLRLDVRPTRNGRYYYLARLEVETLSLSDLEELQRWLRGEVGPAVEGRNSPGGAVESGLRRVFVRVMGLPTRRVEGRSDSFRVP